MGSPALRGSGFDPTPHDAGGGVMPCLGCLDWRCNFDALQAGGCWGLLDSHDLLAKDHLDSILCHTTNRGAWCPVPALPVMRSHLDSGFASCSCSDSMPVGIGRSVGCLL